MIFFFYKLASYLFYPFSSIYLKIRIFNKKEDKQRIKERYGIASRERNPGKLIWFHAASIGESLSIISLIKEIQKKNNSQILITTGTRSSAELITKKLNKVIVHQFLPLDNPLFVERFLSFWKPNVGIFVESEIWPNLILKCKNKKIKLIIINGRMTPKSYKRWSLLPKTSKMLFSCFEECLTQNNDSLSFYKNLGIKKVVNAGNLKFATTQTKLDPLSKKQLGKIFENRKVLVAASTHPGEEDLLADMANKIKALRKDFILIIIPRHPDRNFFLKNQALESIVLRSKSDKVKKDTSIYIADTLGELELFYSIADFIFIGGSFVNHGGQNPIEASYYGKLIHHGKFIQNFTDVYSTLSKMHITNLVETPHQLMQHIQKNYNKPLRSSKIDRLLKIKAEGESILKNNISLLNNYLPKNSNHESN